MKLHSNFSPILRNEGFIQQEAAFSHKGIN